MRVILDTNILVSGIFFRGIPGKIVDAWINEAFSLFTSPAILREYTRTIAEFSLKHDEILSYEWLQTLAELSRMIPDSANAASYCRDKDDDKFIHCAIAAKADYLVTGDKDLTSLQQAFPFKIISPTKFLDKIH